MLLRLRNSRFVRDAAVLQLAAGVTSAGNLLSTLALAFLLGPHFQGIFYLATSLYSLFYLLGNVGLSTVSVSHIASAIKAGDRQGVVAWLGFLTKASAVLAGLLFALALLVLPAVGDFFYDDKRIGHWAVLLCVLPLLEIPRLVAAAAFQATRRMWDLAQLENSIEVSRVFLVVSAILISGKPIGAIWGTLAAGMMSSLLGFLLYQRARKELMADPSSKASLPGLSELRRGMSLIPLRVGLPQGIQVGFLRNLDALVIDVAPLLIMGHFGGPAQVAYFRIAQRLLRLPLTFLQGISRTAVPALAELAHQKDPDRFRRVFYRATLGGGVISSAGILLALPMIPLFVRYALPDDYWTQVPHDALLLAVGFIITSFSGAFESFYIAANRVRAALWIGFGLGPPLLALMVLFGYLFGPDGVVIGLTLALSVGVVHHVYIWRCFQSGDAVRTRERLSFMEKQPQ